uniref:Uncharacterized protein n=1 Tax=Nothoprocta perdicaria TaxID=30464 RepID=A0A8C6ZZW0_NOTPE
QPHLSTLEILLLPSTHGARKIQSFPSVNILGQKGTGLVLRMSSASGARGLLLLPRSKEGTFSGRASGAVLASPSRQLPNAAASPKAREWLS